MKTREPSAPDHPRAFPSETGQRMGSIDNAVLRELHERRVELAERRARIRLRLWLRDALIGAALGAGLGYLVITLLSRP